MISNCVLLSLICALLLRFILGMRSKLTTSSAQYVSLCPFLDRLVCCGAPPPTLVRPPQTARRKCSPKSATKYLGLFLIKATFVRDWRLLKRKRGGVKTHMLVSRKHSRSGSWHSPFGHLWEPLRGKDFCFSENTERRFRHPTLSESRDGRQPGKLEECVCVCVFSCTHTSTAGPGNRRMRSQCDQTHKHADNSTCLNRQYGHSEGTKGTCKQIEADLQSWATSEVLRHHAQGLHLGREQTWTPWMGSGMVEAWKNCPSEGGKEDAPLLLLLSLVVHQRLDFVHQLTSYLQDVLDIVALSHLCRRQKRFVNYRKTNGLFPKAQGFIRLRPLGGATRRGDINRINKFNKTTPHPFGH